MVIIKAAEHKEIKTNSSAYHKKLFFIRMSFVLAWLSFSLIIFVITILADINWTRPGLEQLLGQAVHRNVKLGRLSWHFGLHGFSVYTSRLLVAERSGEPFLMTGNCEIGFSLWSLLKGVGKIQYVDMQKPLFMAIHTGPKTWNFDDLLLISPDIDLIEVHSGHIFVIDRTAEDNKKHFSDTELNNVRVKFKRAGNFSPAEIDLSCDLSTEKNKATYILSGKTWGKANKPWWEEKSHFELTIKRFSVSNWQTITSLATVDSKNLAYTDFLNKLTSAIPIFSNQINSQVLTAKSGQFYFNAIADGIPNKEFAAELQFQSDHLTILSHNNLISIPPTFITAQIHYSPDAFIWNKCIIRIPDYNLLFNTSGSNIICADRKQQNKQWNAMALLGDLKKLNPLFTFLYKDISCDTKYDAKKLFNNLNGKLFCNLRFDNQKQNSEYTIEAKANEVNIDGIKPILVSINKLVSNKTGLSSPFEEEYFQQFELSKQAKFSGTIIGKSKEGVLLKDCALEEDQMSWKISGQSDINGHWQELIITNKDLELDKLAHKITQDPQLNRRTRTYLGLDPNCQINLSGKAQASFKINNSSSKNKNKIGYGCEIKFENANLSFSKPHLDISNLVGTYASNANTLNCKNISFAIGSGGSAELEASISVNKKDPISFLLKAKNINVNELYAILSLFHLDTSYLNGWQLTGKLASIDLQITGTADSPTLILAAIPTDAYFTTPNLKKTIHASGGKIIFNNNSLILEKVNLSNSSSKYLISLVLKNPSTTNNLEKLNLRASNVDLDDLQNYIEATHFINLQQVIKKYQVANLRGNVSGFIDYSSHANKQKLNGIIDLEGINFKLSQTKLICKNLKGKIFINENEILLHDISGSAGNTTFNLHGRLPKYTDANKERLNPKTMPWNGEISAQVAPEDLNDIFLAGISPVQKNLFNLQAKKPVYLKLKNTLHNGLTIVSFGLIGDSDATLSVSIGNITLYQPNKKLTLTGLFNCNEQKLICQNMNFDYGGAAINLQGSISNYRGNKVEPIYNIQIQTADSISANLFKQILYTTGGAWLGQIKGNINIQGSQSNPLAQGKISLIDFSAPDFYISHLIGTISIQPEQINNIPALLQLDKFNLGPMQLSQASGNLIWQPNSSQISLTNFVAKIAEGEFKSDAQFNCKTKKLHLNMNVDNANFAEFWPQVTSSQIKATGILNCNLNIDTNGDTAKDFEQNMIGSGHIHAVQGSFSRLSQLHARLNQVNLLHQGIFGFNFNNVMQSVLPTKATEFSSIDSAFAVDKQLLTVRHIFYQGKDIKFSAAGKINLALHTLDLDIAGLMPRVSNSVLGGKLGELSRDITLQKLLDGVTMHKLEKLPSLPLIGGIAGGPEIFTCKIVSPYDQPKMISQSIEKSFHWLHTK